MAGPLAGSRSQLQLCRPAPFWRQHGGPSGVRRPQGASAGGAPGHHPLQVLRLLSAQGIAPRSRSTPVTTTTTVAATAADGSSANSPSAATASTSSGAADGLIRDVRGATDADAAARVLQAAQQAVAAGSLDPAAAVCLLAALAKAPPAVASSPQLRPLSQAISLLLLEQLDALGAADRSAAVAAFGRLGGWRPTVLLQQVVRAAVADPDAYAPLDAIWLVWGLAKANYKTLQVKALLKRVLARAVSAASRDDDPWARLSVKDLAALMWACGRVGYSSGALLADLTARVMVALPMPPPPAAAEVSAAAGAASAGAAAAPGGAWPKLQWFSNMAWAAGRLKYCNASYLGWVCAWAAAVAPAEPPQPQAISNLAWALCELGHAPSEAFLRVATQQLHAALPDFKPTELSALLFALARWGAAPAVGAATLDVVTQHVVESVGKSTDANDLCLSIWALVKLGARPSAAQLELVAAALQQRGLERAATADVSRFLWACSTCGHSPAQLLRQLGELQLRVLAADAPGRPASGDMEEQGQLLASLAYGLGLHRQSVDGLLPLIERVALRRPRVLTPMQLSSLLWGFARLGYCPTEWFKKGLCRVISGAVPGMRLQQLTDLLWALSQWRQPLQPVIGAQRLQPVLEAIVEQLAASDEWGAAVAAAAATTMTTTTIPPEAVTAAQPAAADGGSSSSSSSSGAAQEQRAAPASPEAAAGGSADFGASGGNGGQLWPAPGTVADIANSLGSLGLADERLLQRIGACASSAAAQYSLKHLISVHWACAKLRHDVPDVSAAIVRRCSGVAAAAAAAASAPPAAAPAQGGRSKAAAAGDAPSAAASPVAPGSALRSLMAAAPPPGASGSPRPTTTSSSSSSAAASADEALSMSSSSVARLLWSFARFNRHPGPLVLQAAHANWSRLAASSPSTGGGGGVDGGGAATRKAKAGTQPAPKEDATPASSSSSPAPAPSSSSSSLSQQQQQQQPSVIASMLYSLALLGEHGHPLTALLARQLSEPALLRHPHLPRQYEHLAACLLASQADQAESPLLAALPPDVRGAAIEAWRARVRKQGAGKPNSYQKDVVDVLRGMELKGRANGVTADACVCADVILALPSDSNRYAIELTGAHNTAGNDPSRVLGEAALKLRLLRARGYMVIPVSCAEWARLGRGDLYAKILYIDARFKQRTGRTTSRSGSAGAAAADPGGSGSDDEGAQPPPGGAGGGPAGITRAAPSILPTPRL